MSMDYINETTASGKCGENLTWDYDKKKKLLAIDGSGPMQFDAIPWEEWKDEIETVFLWECSYICAGAFRGFKNLRGVVVFEEGLKEIGPSAFEDCVSLESFIFSGRAELQKVSDCAFRNCISLKSWDADVSVVGSRAFENCTNMDFEGYQVGTREIGTYAFANCKRLSQLPMYDKDQGWFCYGTPEFQVGYDLSVIPTGAFSGCDGLTKLTIPRMVKKIEPGAFTQCRNLSEIMITVDTEYDRTDFLDAPLVVEGFGICDLYNPRSGVVRWVQKDGVLRFSGNGAIMAEPIDYGWEDPVCPPWKVDKVHTVIIEEGCASVIMQQTFRGHRNLRTVKIPLSTKMIGHYAFAGCVNLETLLIPDTVEIIDPHAFEGVPHIIYHGPAQSDNNWGALSRN